MNLVTPVTPAAVIGHVDASPRRRTVRNCGWDPSDIARVLLLSQGKSLDYDFRLNLEMIEKLFEVHFRGPLIKDSGPVRDLTWQAIKIMQARLLEHLEEMEASGVLVVSVSAYNSDSDCAVVYWEGKPVGEM